MAGTQVEPGLYIGWVDHGYQNNVHLVQDMNVPCLASGTRGLESSSSHNHY